MEKYDFSGWATRANLRCSDGRTILKDAFKHNDGQTVPLVWAHKHDDPMLVLGHALLENRTEGVYAYCAFNETDSGKAAKELVQHGDIKSLSIYANQLKEQNGEVCHGNIREVSLVLAGANPGAFIESIIKHGDSEDGVEVVEGEARIFTGEDIMLFHSEDDVVETDDNDDEEIEEVTKGETEETDKTEENDEADPAVEHSDIEHAEGESNNDDKKADDDKSKGKTLQDVWNTFTEEQKKFVYVLMDELSKEESNNSEESENKEKEGEESMKHNVFEKDEATQAGVLSHGDQTEIIKLAKSNTCGSLQAAIASYSENNASLKHAFNDNELDIIFPEYKDLNSGAPEVVGKDQGWVTKVINGVHKSPISRIRTRFADVNGIAGGDPEVLRALGYKKGDQKALSGAIKLVKRTTDPQTIYRKDALNRDDIIDITDFDVVAYQYGIMKQNLNEEIATAIMIGDQREGGDYKIEEVHVRSIWNDEELYTIHADVDVAAAKAKLQGTNTNANFGDNYVYAEAIIEAALYAREQYKGSGNLEFYCTPHLLNVMLLARDLNGRRIYESKADLAAALNVTAINTAEQFADKVRTDSDSKQHKLLGIFVNLSDYNVGSTKGGEITKFNQFDIDFNQEKYLIETRLSGALTRVKSAIVLEEPVA